jgi:hypothetical protein
MNKKIKELAQQAGVIALSENGIAPPLELFAELIVRECAEFANEHNSEVEGVTLGIGRALKQHFGVE